MTYKFLEHTADIGIEVKAQNLKHAFVEAIKGLIDLIFQTSFNEIVSENSSDILEVSSNDLESLFVDTLNEILYLIDTKKIIPLKPEIIEMSNTFVKLKYQPFNFDLEKTPMHLYVKAVTFHQLEILQSNEATTIRFYLDI